MKHVSFTLVLLFLARAVAQQTAQKTWLMGGACMAFRVPLAEGDQGFQLLTRPDSNVRIAGIVTGCLRSAADGSCSQAADASDAACAGATQSDLPAALEGELHAVPAGTEGFVYVSNNGEMPVLVDILAVVQPKASASTAEATAVGSYRRALLRSARGAVQSGAAVAVKAGTALQHGPRRALLQNSSSPATTDVLAVSSTPSPTPSPASSSSSSPATKDVLANTPTPNSSGSSSSSTNTPTGSTTSGNWIDRIVNHFQDPTVRKWVKIAIIVLIVLVCLSILSCLFCVLRCICWPCCCAARGFK